MMGFAVRYAPNAAEVYRLGTSLKCLGLSWAHHGGCLNGGRGSFQAPTSPTRGALASSLDRGAIFERT